MELIEAQARQAIEQLRAQGWAVGPPAACEEWRRAVRAEARRAGLKIRTGKARGNSDDADGQVHPWAATVEGHNAARERFGGMDLATLGTVLVTADAGRRTGGR